MRLLGFLLGRLLVVVRRGRPLRWVSSLVAGFRSRQVRRPVSFLFGSLALCALVWPLRSGAVDAPVLSAGAAPLSSDAFPSSRSADGADPAELAPGWGSFEQLKDRLAGFRGSWWLSDGDAVSSSRYVHWMTSDPAADRAHAEVLGCQGSGESGPLVLAFGRQVEGGTRGFDGPRVLRSYDQIREVVLGFLDGLQRCGSGPRLVAVTTSNYRLDDVAEAERFGFEWGRLVASISPPAGLLVTGGSDLEPGWGAPEAARSWVHAYRRWGLPLVANASADGCPQSGVTGRCANGWTVELLAELVWGGHSVAVPQIYRLDGAQARQWGVLAASWRASGGEVRFAGAMTQVRACLQVANRNCPQLSLDPVGARRQLSEASGADVPAGTDIGWG